MIASEMACSMALNVESREAFALINGVSCLSVTMASRAARAARRLAPISINARGERDEPICARCSEARTSENESIGVPPK